MNRSTKMETIPFEEVTGNIETKVKNIKKIFESLNQQMNNLDGSSKVWQGRAQELIYKKYNDISKKYSSINEQLDAYVAFLKETINNYKLEEEAIEKSASNSEVDLNI